MLVIIDLDAKICVRCNRAVCIWDPALSKEQSFQTGLQPISILCTASKGGTGAHLLGVPTRTGNPGKMGRHFPVREKSGNFEQTGIVGENHTKIL